MDRRNRADMAAWLSALQQALNRGKPPADYALAALSVRHDLMSGTRWQWLALGDQLPVGLQRFDELGLLGLVDLGPRCTNC